MKMRRAYYLFITLMLLLHSVAVGVADVSTAVAEGNGSLRIVVDSEAQVAGERILLGQASTITGGSEAVRRTLSQIDLGPAPRPGQERRITGSSISVAIANAGVAGEGVLKTIPERMLVKGTCQNISEASLEAVFKKYVTSAVGGDEVAFSRMDVRGLKPLPMGKITLTPLTSRMGEIKGKTTLRLTVTVDGENCGQVTVSGWVDRYAHVVCAARPLSRNTILSSEDLCIERINLAKAADRLIFDIAEAVGKRVRSSLTAGKYIQQHKLMVVPLVEKGARVKLMVSAGPVSISTLGVAKADGGAGDQIRVENLSSQKTVVGKVLDASTVEVLF